MRTEDHRCVILCNALDPVSWIHLQIETLLQGSRVSRISYKGDAECMLYDLQSSGTALDLKSEQVVQWHVS